MSVDFNPGGRPDIKDIKEAYAHTYDLVDGRCDEAVSRIHEDPSLTLVEKGERVADVRRNQALTRTQLELSQMLAVKAVTR
jgi:hypothetical protein